jgi:hypothetical protein
MESFTIKLLESNLTIEPLENGLYRVMDGDTKIGVIYPEAEGDEVVWNTQDDLDNLFVQQIGELITEHNM